ncbi:methyltransferase domain-containing protein [Heliobacterium undosum]|uniref:Methyltransferase domain-containing protein n=1 Tax=Heliomicrobium undosum TaxID=121734 RepID=A0A845L714_9FIRM|nr:methyltransferase [Heliomicrobium undosum]MZP30604.1 methyltransferase domain-containing protein [Heliomicrobium undosum]
MPTLAQPIAAPNELLLVGAAFKTGIFDTLYETPMSLTELAERRNLDVRALWTVIEALKSLGYLIEIAEPSPSSESVKSGMPSDLAASCAGDGKLALTEAAEQLFFLENSENYIGHALIHTFNVIRSWSQIPEVLRKGQPAERDQEELDIQGFMAAMKKNAKSAVSVIRPCLEGLTPSGLTVLDLGGGPLNYARPFAAEGCIVTVQDTPEVCQLMEKQLAPGETIRFAPIDFTESVVEGPFDLAFLGNISHIYGPKENLALFRRVHAALKPGGRIAILDFVRAVSPMAAMFAVNMLVNTKTGGTWTMDQYRQWLEEEKRYENVRLVPLEHQHLILAEKASQ